MKKIEKYQTRKKKVKRNEKRDEIEKKKERKESELLPKVGELGGQCLKKKKNIFVLTWDFWSLTLTTWLT